LNATAAAAAGAAWPRALVQRLRARISRALSRCQSRSFSVSRLSCCFLPRASPISSFARPFFQYIDSGISVIPYVGDLAKAGNESPVIRFVNYLIFDAIKQGASDIHIEPKEKQLKICYRIDGVLFEAMKVVTK